MINILRFIRDKRSWILIIPLTLFAFGMCFFKLPLPGVFSIDKKLADGLIDSRIQNLATISAMSIAVMGFLMTNLKEKNKDSYDILFKYSYIYPIVYFILSVIGLSIVIAYFKTSFGQKNEEIYIKMVILTMYMSIFVLFFIGFLLSRIIHFANPTFLLDKFLAEKTIEFYNSFTRTGSLKKQETINNIMTDLSDKIKWLIKNDDTIGAIKANELYAEFYQRIVQVSDKSTNDDLLQQYS
jgi:hypothetical protein